MFNYPPQSTLKFYTALQLKILETKFHHVGANLFFEYIYKGPAALQHFMSTGKALNPKNQITGLSKPLVGWNGEAKEL